mmetsp:Transcript_91719/g.159065  ORF Transcript_91719/g.159065 Transcript_91719/m.159065 type:complete len:233 (+) Transcript_91719:99-797(+)
MTTLGDASWTSCRRATRPPCTARGTVTAATSFPGSIPSPPAGPVPWTPPPPPSAPRTQPPHPSPWWPTSWPCVVGSCSSVPPAPSTACCCWSTAPCPGPLPRPPLSMSPAVPARTPQQGPRPLPPPRTSRTAPPMRTGTRTGARSRCSWGTWSASCPHCPGRSPARRRSTSGTCGASSFCTAPAPCAAWPSTRGSSPGRSSSPSNAAPRPSSSGSGSRASCPPCWSMPLRTS